MAINPAITPGTPESVPLDAALLSRLHEPPRQVRPPFTALPQSDPHPTEPRSWQADRVAALLEALNGVELGAHDRRIIDWLAGWEVSTVGTVVSLIYRARAAGTAGGAQ